MKIIKRRRTIHANKTYVWRGGTAQILVMQAGYRQSGIGGRRYYGYDSTYGTLNPKYIEYQGKQYEIDAFYTTPFNVSLLMFKNIELPATTIVIEVNGKKYTMVKNADTGSFKIETSIFTDTGTYTIKILSIE